MEIKIDPPRVARITSSKVAKIPRLTQGNVHIFHTIVVYSHPVSFKHGFSAYQNGLCRCDDCRTAASSYQKNQRHKRWRRTQAEGVPDSVEHGVGAYTNWGCRCDTCRIAQNERMRNYKKKSQQ